MTTSKPAVSVTTDQVIITATRATAEALRDELLWAKVDDNGPARGLWEALDDALPDHD